MDLVRTNIRNFASPSGMILMDGRMYANEVSLPSGGISTFGPLIIEAFGFDQFTTILFNIPYGAVQFVSILGGAWMATKLGMKGPVLVLLCLPSIAGCVMLLCISRDPSSKGVLLAGYYIVRRNTCVYMVLLLTTYEDFSLPRYQYVGHCQDAG